MNIQTSHTSFYHIRLVFIFNYDSGSGTISTPSLTDSGWLDSHCTSVFLYELVYSLSFYMNDYSRWRLVTVPSLILYCGPESSTGNRLHPTLRPKLVTYLKSIRHLYTFSFVSLVRKTSYLLLNRSSILLTKYMLLSFRHRRLQNIMF